MRSNITTVDICIATYKRQAGLRELLTSIVNQNKSEHIKVRFIVIDNDPEKSAQPVMDDFFQDADINYIYDMQPEKNIAHTRNKALDYAMADYVVFVDDDEWVTPNWLENLLLASDKYDADVVFGPVIPEFPIDTPDWIIKGGFFKDGATESGDLRKHGATNNALVRHSAKIKPLLRLNPDYGLTGGSDTELFHRLYNNGAKLIWCNEAPVYELVPYERMKISWLAKRALRGGQVYARVFHKNQSINKTIIYFVKRASYLFVACALFPFSFLMGKCKWVWVLRKIMANAGQLSMLFTNNAYQEYK